MAKMSVFPRQKYLFKTDFNELRAESIFMMTKYSKFFSLVEGLRTIYAEKSLLLSYSISNLFLLLLCQSFCILSFLKFDFKVCYNFLFSIFLKTLNMEHNGTVTTRKIRREKERLRTKGRA